MSNFLFLLKHISSGQSITRSLLNLRLKQEVLRGKTIDVGGGKNADYISFMKNSDDFELTTFDIKAGQKDVDFETDRLPAEDGVYDTVLFLNVMEHIFNHQHIANEVVRIVKPGGQLIGFVPFLMWYHPDHRDFFRYTHEALEIILRKAGAANIRIEPVAKGPFTAAAQMELLRLPRLVRPLIFITSYLMDKLYLAIGKKGDRYALGYVFIVNK